MMHAITKKTELKQILEHCKRCYENEGLDALTSSVHEDILIHKVKFPLLEYCARVIYQFLPAEEHLLFCDQIQPLKTIGGNVLLGIILQSRLEHHFEESIYKTTEYIEKADIWYICDIIGERVFGYSILNDPDLTLPEIERLSRHESRWVIRSLGAGGHYAIKKGLQKPHVKSLFRLWLTMASDPDKEIRQGVGWAAKTTAKFHPDIIKYYQNQIDDTQKVANWFRRKVKIGLERHAYAQRSRSQISS